MGCVYLKQSGAKNLSLEADFPLLLRANLRLGVVRDCWQREGGQPLPETASQMCQSSSAMLCGVDLPIKSPVQKFPELL